MQTITPTPIDLAVIDTLQDNTPVWQLSPTLDGEHGDIRLVVYGLATPATLSKILPILENFGVSVITAQTYLFDNQDKNAWRQEYRLKPKAGLNFDLQAVHQQIQDSLGEIWQGRVENDKLNELILTTNLDTYEVVVLRALSRYMVQARLPFSADYIYGSLINNPTISAAIVELFHAKFNPTAQSDTAPILANIQENLSQIKSLDEDRIIRSLLDLMAAVVRTNFYQRTNGQRKDRLSFKFKASDIPFLPKPKPMFEIFVYSPRVEGVHLRGGKVARGGLRWSDRMEDYRTEVLGLVKAQMVKNAVIVPVGSKGGFVCKDKSMQADREAWQKEGVACYQTYIRGLLDVTDNLIDGQIIPPADTVRLDPDDPYLVVAADKGTATFSDIANGLSKEYNFWLQDAFASGGSAGYDHKGMGITARGAWESVKRHFRLIGKDIQAKDEFTVIGIGDMSGDVFGNGMLLSDKTKLVAAFNHLHIFIDPNPADTKQSFAERERLFNLPRSAWTDYNAGLISAGGGVFNRTDKAIAISPQMKERFDISEDSLTPNELLNKLLKAPVDLIWNGGIGTYIKASSEEHFEVGDRANDVIRVNGKEVRAKVVGEGGNLGCTQQGRIEYALNGGRIYTDAIDNSGGVNCSDHEVNIKILLGAKVQKGDMSLEQRNDLLASMTDSVASLVLRQNYLQPQAIELSSFETKERLPEHARFIHFLENLGRLDRAIEFLPSDEVIAERQKQGKGLTNPEFAVLLAYGKMWVYEEMLNSDLPDDDYFYGELKKYFPKQLEGLFDEMKQHRLHREIICTYLTNGLVNRLGIENVFYLYDEIGQSISEMTRAYAIVRDVFDIRKMWDELIALDNIAPAGVQLAIEVDIRKLLNSTMAWFVANEGVTNITHLAQKYKNAVQALMGNVPIFDKYFANAINSRADELTRLGVPADDAKVFARVPVYAHALDVVKLADEKGMELQKVADAYFGVYNTLNMDKLTAYAQELPKTSYWDRRAVSALVQELNRTQLALINRALKRDNFEAWQADNQAALDDIAVQYKEATASPSLASLSVLLSEINGLKQVQ